MRFPCGCDGMGERMQKFLVGAGNVRRRKTKQKAKNGTAFSVLSFGNVAGILERTKMRAPLDSCGPLFCLILYPHSLYRGCHATGAALGAFSR